MNRLHDLARRTTFLGLALCIAVPATEAREERIRLMAAPATAVAAATEGCAGGLVNDDGVFEGVAGFHAQEGEPGTFDAVMLFRGPAAGRHLEQVCVCWERRPGASSTLAHEIVLFRADGPGGSPGAQPVAVLDAVAQGIGTTPTVLGYDVAAANVLTPAADFYLGVRWSAGVDGEDHTLCFDDGSPPVHPKFVKPAAGTEWTDLDELFAQAPFPLPPIRALGIRAELAAPQQPPPPATCPIGACVEDEVTICLNGGRFAVTVDFDPPNDADALTEPARAQRLTEDTGYFTFFDPENVEVVIKVLAACPVNDHHWVFAGGLTNVFTEIEVCDKASGVRKTYTNPQSTSFQPIQDTAAFATCP